MTIRDITAYKDYFIKFFDKQELKVQLKIEYVLDLIRYERNVPAKFFKHLENSDGIYEVRVITTFKSIRILCFIDNGKLIVLANCFLKKRQKTPVKEIRFAERLKKEYLKKNGDKKMKNTTNFEDILKKKYGEKGSPNRDIYETNSLAFRLGVMLKEARREAHITQKELADRIGTKKSYISRIERGKSDIQLSTYHKLIEIGLGRILHISIEP